MVVAAPPLTESKPALNFVRQAQAAGCPEDQVRNFVLGMYLPLPWALDFHAAARAGDLPDGPDEIGLGGSRGPGKSHAIFSQVALDDCQRVPGLKVLYLRKVGKQAREQMEDLIGTVLFATPHKFNRSAGVVSFPNGSRIVMGHFRNESDVDNYLGIEYDVIAIEETTTLSTTKYKTLRDSNRTSKQNFRPRIYNSTNPGGVGHAWYKARFVNPHRDGAEHFTKFIPATVDDNPLIDPDYERKLNENTGWRLRAYRYGDWDIAAGAFFSTYRYDVHVSEPLWNRIPQGWRVWCAMDYGFHHWLVVHLIAEDGDGHLYHVDEHAARQWQIEQHARAIHTMLARWGVSVETLRTFVAGADVFAKRDEGPTIAEKFKKQGIRLQAANMDRVNGWAEVLALLGDVEMGILPRWKIFTTCPMLIGTLPYLQHDPRRPEDVLKVDCDDEGNGGDDAGDCARYGLMVDDGRQLRTADVDFYGDGAPAYDSTPTRSQAEVDQMLSDFDTDSGNAYE